MVDDIAQLTRELVAIPSVTGSTIALSAVVQFVEQWFADTPQAVVRHYECNGRTSIVIGTHDTLTPVVALVGHLDVVPVASTEMFAVREEEGLLYGRGVCDMKGSIAVMMIEMKSWLQSGLAVPISLILTTDEEVGGANGLRYLVEEVGYRPGVALIPDGGDDLGEIVIGTKGILHLKMTQRGVPAHASRPWLGQNAIMSLMAEYESLAGRLTSGDPSCDWVDSWSVSTISGGSAHNQVPDHAELTADIRFVEGRTVEDVVSRIQSVASCEVEILARGEARYTSQDDPAIVRYVDVLKAHDIVPRFTKSHGTDDGRYLSAQGVPVIVSQARSGGHHSEGEWMDLASLAQYGTIIHDFIVATIAEESKTVAE